MAINMIQTQSGSTSIQWIILSLALSIVLFGAVEDDKSAAELLEQEIKTTYEKQTYSGGLP